MSSSFTRPGAVDLSALAAKAKKAAEAASGAPGRAAGSTGSTSGSSVVIDVTEADFQAKVIDQSMTVPVVVDFWADWCEPCKKLSPILAKVATEYGGRFLVAKVDIEANQQLAAAAGVQSIPLVIAIVRGQVVPMFNGALPEAQVRQVIDELLRVAAENGVTGSLDLATDDGGEEEEAEAAEPAIDPRYEAAETAMAEGDFTTARAEFQKLLAAAPADAVARQGLVNADVLERSLAADEPALRAKAAADPADVETAIALADVEITGGQTEAAFRRLIACVQVTSGPDRERARTHLVELFDLVGAADPLVIAARRQLASALF